MMSFWKTTCRRACEWVAKEPREKSKVHYLELAKS